MTRDPTPTEGTLGQLAALTEHAARARAAERAALDERAEAIVAAVRAGARLGEIGTAAGMTKAAASAIARRTLAPRAGSGGPYRRRRGAGVALERVTETARVAAAEGLAAASAILERDRAIVRAAEEAGTVASIAEAVGMQPKVIHTLIRRRRQEATLMPNGTVAS